jgi:hypothetical protein
MLDDKQNQLLQMGAVLSTATLMVKLRHRRHRGARHQHPHRAVQDPHHRRLLGGRRRHARRRGRAIRRRHGLLPEERHTAVTMRCNFFPERVNVLSLLAGHFKFGQYHVPNLKF